MEKINQSQKILQTAFQCLSARGYANVSMRDIADEAGVALSQLSYYYKNKEGLFTEVVKMMMHQYLHEVEDKLKSTANTTANTKEKLASLVRYFTEQIKKNPDLLRLFIDFTAQSLWLPSFRRQLKKLFSDLSEMIEKSLLVGTVLNTNLCEYSSKSVAKLILGALYGTSIQIILDSDEDNAFDSLNLVGMILN